MTTLTTKLGNTIIAREEDLAAAKNLINLLNIFEEDQNNEFNFYNNCEEKFEVKLIFNDFRGRVLSEVSAKPSENAMGPKITEEFNTFYKNYKNAYKLYNANVRFWSKERKEIESDRLDALDAELENYKKEYSRPDVIYLDLSIKCVLEHLEEIFNNLTPGQVFGQFEVLLHEICHIYTSNKVGVHGPEFKSNCKYFANKISEKYWPVDGVRFGRATYRTQLYVNLNALLGVNK